MMLYKLTYVPMIQPKSPTMKMNEFFAKRRLKYLGSCQLDARSMRAGAMMLKVDIFTAPNKETNKSSQGTVAARATGIENKTG